MKYRLTENKKEWLGHTLYQIEALKDFGSVKKGDLGELNEFAAKVDETHANNVYGMEYKALIELIKIHFGVKENV